jgi:hypothetical protein
MWEVILFTLGMCDGFEPRVSAADGTSAARGSWEASTAFRSCIVPLNRWERSTFNVQRSTFNGRPSTINLPSINRFMGSTLTGLRPVCVASNIEVQSGTQSAKSGFCNLFVLWNIETSYLEAPSSILNCIMPMNLMFCAADGTSAVRGGSWEAPLALCPCTVPLNRGGPRGVQSDGSWGAASSCLNCMMPMNLGAGVLGLADWQSAIRQAGSLRYNMSVRGKLPRPFVRAKCP